ncbi:MAG TPA: isoleucine--tRNA ligase [Candidatus Binatia bacterium]|nr:isoleucine--tRNA ligase [Candidatus Binatia bacterium]
MDYKETLNLPKTQFPMRANLPQNEPKQVEKWDSKQTYFGMLEANAGQTKFILHDGPPYANGNIHLGHALNKILKDMIVKYKAMTRHRAPYVPGWDCHGLPIELQVEKNIGRAKKLAVSKAEIRRLCKEYAETFIAVQREEFKRLGVLGDWERPYRTMDPHYEGQEIRELGKIAGSGILYRQKKPVYWCASCVTALAEAEVEYEDHTSPSIYVKFPVKDPKGKFAVDPAKGTHFVIWTTTPWTLPANQAIAVHPKFMYRHVQTPYGELIINQELIPAVMKALELEDYEVTDGAWAGADLEGIVCRHPWLDRDSPVVLGEFVTQDQGTGSVHIAPGHGQEDYELGLRYRLEVLAPVDAEGKFTAEAGDLQGESVFKADTRIIQKLLERGALLKQEKLPHSYPHCWRCKKPVIFRATEQWFISMDAKGLRRDALNAIEQVRWIPPWGKDRIRGMLESRPDWCISRQRSWGVPIPAVYCKKCHQAVLTQQLCDHVASIFDQEGSDAWFVRPVSELVPPALKCPNCGGGDFSREEDILDVWFDSGVSHAAVVEADPRLGDRADLYLEGSDQHRGWFHTSLLTSVATRGRPPYKSVLTHGFTLDGKGRKMSKSLGNVIAPQEIIKKYGAEILRLWVSAEDYREDVRISDEILNRLVEAYRRLRNTARFLISNLYDFDPARDALSAEDLEELDRWILHRTQNVLNRCREAYDKYEFHVVYHTLNNFCSVDLSAQYLDIVKDRLYCEGAASKKRRAAQTTLYRILDTLVHLMAPILSFTAEEIWQYMPDKERRPASVFLSSIPVPEPALMDSELASRWDRIFQERGEVLKALEQARAAGLIGHSLDAKVVLYSQNGNQNSPLLGMVSSDRRKSADLLIVSQAKFSNEIASFLDQLIIAKNSGQRGANIIVDLPDDVRVCSFDAELLNSFIAVFKAEGAKCERCWKYDTLTSSDAPHPNVCPRCAEVLRSGVSA